MSLILDLALGKLSRPEFLLAFRPFSADPSSLIIFCLQESYEERSPDGVDRAMLLGYSFQFTTSHVEILCKLAFADWHFKHEEIARALDIIRDPCAIDALEYLARTKYPYLEYDDSRALAVKAIWALGNLGSIITLGRLVSDDDSIVRDAALSQLHRLRGG